MELSQAVPLAAPKGARGHYEIGDAYLSFWYRVLASDATLTYALWTRSGVDPALTHRGARSFTVADMLR